MTGRQPRTNDGPEFQFEIVRYLLVPGFGKRVERGVLARARTHDDAVKLTGEAVNGAVRNGAVVDSRYHLEMTPPIPVYVLAKSNGTSLDRHVYTFEKRSE